MSKNLQPFSMTPICPKCGGREVSRAYCAGGNPYQDHRHGGYRDGISIRCPGTEHHDLHCRNCQYGWLETVKPEKTKARAA